jgi:hypothetical protein
VLSSFILNIYIDKTEFNGIVLRIFCTIFWTKGTYMSFLSDIEDFKEQALQDASDAMNNIVSDFFVKTIQLSPTSDSLPRVAPYANNLLINQYYPASGVGTFSNELGTNTDVRGSDSLERVKSLLEQHLFYGRDNAVSLANNTEEAYYADKLGWQKGEGTGGWTWKGALPYNMTEGALNYVLNKQ